MNNRDMPENANQWSDFLIESTLPANALVGKMVLESIKEKDLPYKKVAEQINRDPVFSLHVMSAANRNKDAEAPSSKTLEHAISMIGTDKLRSIAQKLPTEKANNNDPKSFYYTRVMGNSLFAAYFARTLSKLKQAGQPDSLYWGALFCGVPMWYLWRFATPSMKRIGDEIRTTLTPSEKAERDILGCSILELARELVGKLDLPPLTKACYNPENQLSLKQWISMGKHMSDDGKPLKVDSKEINHLTSRPEFMIALSNLLAHYAAQDWYSHATLRVQKVVAVFLGIPLQQAIKISHECAVEASRAHPLSGVMLPAAKLLLPPRPRSVAVKVKQKAPAASNTEKILTAPTSIASPVEAESIEQAQPSLATSQTKDSSTAVQAATASKKPDSDDKNVNNSTKSTNKGDIEFVGEKVKQQGLIKPAAINTQQSPDNAALVEKQTPSEKPQPQRGNKDTFAQFTDIIINDPDSFVDLHELMNAVTQCIAYGLGLSRAVVALVNTNQTRLKAYYSVGTRDYPKLGNFQIDLKKPSLFSRLMDKPSSIWVKPDSSKNIWSMIPNEFKAANETRDFFMMSIFVNQKPVAVFYADSGLNSAACNEYEYKQFKYLCNAATKCLQHQATQRAQTE